MAATVPRKPLPQRDEASSPSDKTTIDYSTLEAVDPERPPELVEDAGLQSTHLYGDGKLNEKEVAKADGMEVTRDDDKELSTPSDVERGTENGRKEWWRRKIIGIPVWFIIAVGLVLTIGGAVGGGVGATAGKQSSSSNSTLTPTTMMETATATPTPLPPSPHGPQQNIWYMLIQYNGTEDEHTAMLMTGSGGGGSDLFADLTNPEYSSVDTNDGNRGVWWQFTPVTTTPHSGLERSGLYWITNKYHTGNWNSIARAREDMTVSMVSLDDDSTLKEDAASMWYVQDSQSGRVNAAGEINATLWSVWNYQTEMRLGRRGESVKLVQDQSEAYDYVWVPQMF